MRHITLAAVMTFWLAGLPAIASPREVDEAVAAGRAAVAASDDARAIALFERAIALDPSRSDAYYSVGLLYRSRERWRDALDAFRRAAASPSAPAEAHCQIGELLTEVFAKPQEAVRHLRRATRVDPDYPRSHLLLGVALLQTGDPAGARAALREAARLDPGDAETAFQMGTAAARLGDLDGARQSFERAIAASRLHAKSHLGLGNCLMRLGSAPAGREALGAFRRLSVQAEQITRLERLVSNDASRASVWAELGDVRLARAEWASAAAAFERAVGASDLDDAKAGVRHRERLGYAYFRLDRYKDAAAAFEAVVQLAPDVAAYRNSLAGAYLMADDAAGAIEHYSVAVELSPDDPRLRMNLARAYEQAGQDDRADAARAAHARLAAPEE